MFYFIAFQSQRTETSKRRLYSKIQIVVILSCLRKFVLVFSFRQKSTFIGSVLRVLSTYPEPAATVWFQGTDYKFKRCFWWIWNFRRAFQWASICSRSTMKKPRPLKFFYYLHFGIWNGICAQVAEAYLEPSRILARSR